jgi:hypothetical protein
MPIRSQPNVKIAFRRVPRKYGLVECIFTTLIEWGVYSVMIKAGRCSNTEYRLPDPQHLALRAYLPLGPVFVRERSRIQTGSRSFRANAVSPVRRARHTQSNQDYCFGDFWSQRRLDPYPRWPRYRVSGPTQAGNKIVSSELRSSPSGSIVRSYWAE